ncbi:MFS family permease [Sphingomonas sp. BE270]|nr:aromatic acid/H+ symport family MFS transporter [Sphingomonas sp. BE270]MDR7260060.1 MFS family permease [Sphingomonas sp. BE270]
MLVLASSFILNALDGMDIVIMSYIAPVLAADWDLDPQRLGVVFSASLAGMTVGGLVIAPLADRFGRRPLILIVLSVITVTMIASGFSRAITEMVIARFIIGVGIGAILACVTAIAADFAPEGQRAFAVSLAISGYPLGAVLTGLASATLVPVHGWRPMLIGAGCISFALLPIMFLTIRESRNLSAAATGKAFRLRRVFEDRRLWPTLSLWLGIAMGFMTFYFVVSWITQLATVAGLPLNRAIYAGALFNLGGFLGTIFVGRLGARYGLPRVTFFTMAAAAILLTLFGAVAMPLAATLGMAMLMGMATNGGFNAFYGLAAELYPAEVRSTGIGWAMGIGRIGAVAGPLLGGVLMQGGFSLAALMATFAVPVLISAVAALCIGLGNRGKG